jgi:hypothetical protein
MALAAAAAEAAAALPPNGGWGGRAAPKLPLNPLPRLDCKVESLVDRSNSMLQVALFALA